MTNICCKVIYFLFFLLGLQFPLWITCTSHVLPKSVLKFPKARSVFLVSIIRRSGLILLGVVVIHTNDLVSFRIYSLELLIITFFHHNSRSTKDGDYLIMWKHSRRGFVNCLRSLQVSPLFQTWKANEKAEFVTIFSGSKRKK